MNNLVRGVITAVILGGTMFVAGAARAQLAFSVSLNTAPLMGNVNGPFYLDFQLNDGSGTNDANNTATISDFELAGGSAAGAPAASGGAGGNIGSTVTITDSRFFNELYQPFKPGSTLSFRVNMTTNPDAGAAPDEFSFALLDGNLNNIPTQGNGAFVVVDIASATPAVITFAADSPYSGIAAPIIGFSGASVPEPGAAALFVAAIVPWMVAVRRRRTGSL